MKEQREKAPVAYGVGEKKVIKKLEIQRETREMLKSNGLVGSQAYRCTNDGIALANSEIETTFNNQKHVKNKTET